MNIFNIIAGICSILGLVVSLFVASKVQKISESNNHNSGKLNQGDGVQKVVENHSIYAENNSNATYNDYTGAIIAGEIDEPPVLSEVKYLVDTTEIDKYHLGIAKNTVDLNVMNAINTLCFTVDFKDIVSKPEDNRWIGYSIKSLPMNDWRNFVNMDYCLNFDYLSEENIGQVWLEITNFRINKKICKRKLELSLEEKHFNLRLSDYKSVIEDWKSVDEICIVFFPEDCIGQHGRVYIMNMSIQKNNLET